MTAAPTINRVEVQLIQNLEKTEFPDASQPFSVEVVVSAKNLRSTREKLSVGIGIETENGLRIGGFNNLEKDVYIEKPQSEGSGLLKVIFEFEKGLPFWAEGNYSIVVGVHDANLSRTLFIGRVSTLTLKNSFLGPNKDGDIVGLSRHVSHVNVNYSEAVES